MAHHTFPGAQNLMRIHNYTSSDQDQETLGFLVLVGRRLSGLWSFLNPTGAMFRDFKGNCFVFLLMLLVVVHVRLQFPCPCLAELRVGFYNRTCPSAESIVLANVKEAVRFDCQNAAVLLRAHFHDCFVEGCDGSILVDNGEESEKNAFGHLGVGGFEIIEGAKAQLERVCPGVVSCADIIALAARDAVALSRGPFYEVPTGRRDGLVSNKSLAADMPDVDDSIGVIRSKFRQKGLSDKDLVLLSAAHSIGTTACFFMGTRLYRFNHRRASDPSIDPRFLPALKAKCPLNGDVNVRLPLDPVTESILDDQILHNIRSRFAVISSDARLYDNESTRRVVDSYVRGGSFATGFAEAMIKMGRIGTNRGRQGEIRRVCSSFNR